MRLGLGLVHLFLGLQLQLLTTAIVAPVASFFFFIFTYLKELSPHKPMTFRVRLIAASVLTGGVNVSVKGRSFNIWPPNGLTGELSSV